MTIGTGTGETYDNGVQHTLAMHNPTFDQRWDQNIEGLVSQGADTAQFMSGNMKMMPQATPKDPANEDDHLGISKRLKTDTERYRDETEQGKRRIPIYVPGSGSPFHAGATISQHIDRDHDVPLLAAALDDGNGFYGTAVDRRIPHAFTNEGITYDPAKFVYMHEKIEHADMTENNIPYQEAHDDTATPFEKDLVQGFAKENGVDPDKFWKNHQQFWTSQLEKANAQPPEKVHPHTYLKPYEDSKHKYLKEMKNGREAGHN